MQTFLLALGLKTWLNIVAVEELLLPFSIFGGLKTINELIELMDFTNNFLISFCYLDESYPNPTLLCTFLYSVNNMFNFSFPCINLHIIFNEDFHPSSLHIPSYLILFLIHYLSFSKFPHFLRIS